MRMQPALTHHFVKSEDLNHHGTLFAGRTAEWFVEAGLMAAAVHPPAQNIVCVKIHGMNFTRPIQLGEIVELVSKAVHAGRTSMVSHIQLNVRGQVLLEGFITFVNVGEDGRPQPHGVTLEPANAEEERLQRQALALPR